MIELSVYQQDNLTAKVIKTTTGYLTELYMDNRLVQKYSFHNETEAEDMAEDFVQGGNRIKHLLNE